MVFDGVAPVVDATKTNIRVELERWWLARLLRSEVFGFPKSFPLCLYGGE